MQALTMARQRLRARLQSPRTPQPVRLAHELVEDGRGRALPALSSVLARDILTRGYDARTLDRIYANRPSHELGLMSRVADRVVLDISIHQAMRERLEAAGGEMRAAVVLASRAETGDVRVLCARCGLGVELVELARALQASHPELLGRVRAWGVDPDPTGQLLPEAATRVAAAGLHTRFIREDLRRRREVDAVARREGPFHLITCLNISPLQSPADTAEVVRHYAGLLAPGGTLLIDRWEATERCRVAEGLGITLQRPTVRDFRAMLAEAGLAMQREHPTGEGGCVLVVAGRRT